jgi:hypothetical protein
MRVEAVFTETCTSGQSLANLCRETFECVFQKLSEERIRWALGSYATPNFPTKRVETSSCTQITPGTFKCLDCHQLGKILSINRAVGWVERSETHHFA